MKFNRLKASITNNASEQPSVYMAICAFESMLRDLEDESGRSVEQLPAGDEMLSAKLLWLCRVLKRIYTGRSEELQRSRAKLDRAMEDLQTAEEELAHFAGEEEKLAQLLRKKTQTERELEQARTANAECVRVQEQVAAMEQKLARLQEMDLDEEKARLASLLSQTGSLEAEQKQLTAQFGEEQGKLAAAKSARAEAEKKLQSCEQEKARELQRCAELESRGREIGEEVQRLQNDCRTADGQQEELQQRKEKLEMELEQKKELLAEYQNREVDPLVEELKKARIEIEAYEEEKGQGKAKLQQLKQQRDQIIAEIAADKGKCEEAERALKAKEQEHVKAEGKRLNAEKQERELQEKLDGLRDKLNSLQTAVADLEDRQLPEQQRLTEEEETRHGKLQEQLSRLSQGKTQIQEENDELESQVKEIEKDIDVFQKTYDSRISDYKNKSQELQTLEEKIKELEGKDEVQGYATYKQQLEERRAQMEKICCESAELTGEISRLDRELEQKRAENSELIAKRDQRDSVSRELSQRQKELQEVLSGNYEEEIARSLRRLALVKEGQKRLSKTLSAVMDITGTAPMGEQGLSLLRQTGQVVNSLGNAAFALQTNLKKCAECLDWKDGDQ
ncbi:MAG: hypothetical protein IKH34_06865 [Oscillospiraceae bacterium]|nr:hypothetical protein [Oscillospiraceae bacterium]